MTTAPSRPGRKLVNAVMLTLTGVAAFLVVVPLLLIFYHLLSQGAGALNLDFFTQLPAPVGETGGGMANAILGTFLLVFYAGVMGIPSGWGPVCIWRRPERAPWPTPFGSWLMS